ncbi:hypothetical protein D3C85_1945540 [compost metagenome]
MQILGTGCGELILALDQARIEREALPILQLAFTHTVELFCAAEQPVPRTSLLDQVERFVMEKR